MLVYLDSSNVFEALKGRLDLSALAEREGARLVFSWAHFDDASGGGARGLAELADFIKRWPNVRFAINPRQIPALEFRNFVDARPLLPVSAPSVIASAESELSALVADASSIASAPTYTVGALEIKLDELREMKRLGAKASTLSKQANATKRPSATPPTPEEGAQILINSMLSHDEETISLMRRGAESDEIPLLPDAVQGGGEVQQLLWQDMHLFQRRMLRTALARDVKAVVELLAEQRDLIPRLEADPLLGPIVTANRDESERWKSFNMNCVLPSQQEVLPASSLQEVYHAMIAHPELCPAWTLRWKVEARMQRDAKTPTKSSDDADLDHLMLLPYVDVIFVDSRIHVYVTQTKDISPSDKAKCMRTKDAAHWLASLQ